MRGDGKSPRTIEGYTDSVRQLAAFLKGRGFLPPERATAEHVREWLNQLRDKGNRPATVNTRYRGAHAFYRWLIREGEIRENPLDRIDPPRVPEAVQPYYTPVELQVILKAGIIGITHPKRVCCKARCQRCFLTGTLCCTSRDTLEHKHASACHVVILAVRIDRYNAGMENESPPNISLMFVAKPWWSRFFKALELAIFGSVWFEGKIAKIEEGGSPSNEPPSR